VIESAISNNNAKTGGKLATPRHGGHRIEKRRR
jgi:hypothetical protein